MKKIEYILGFLGIFLVLFLGSTLLKTDLLFFRLLIGVGLGYTLSRAYTGFAGSVNRAYRTGSTKLMRTLIFMFFISALITVGFLYMAGPTSNNLWINPINMGLIVGAFLFGFGMSISVCCASGVLTDLSAGFPRAFITLIFFGVGVLLGFPIQRTAGWVRNSWFITPTGVEINEGIFLPDLFQWDGFGGYLGALMLIAIFGAIVIFVSYYYEKKLRQNNNFPGHGMEMQQEQLEGIDIKNFKLFSAETYHHIFAKPWTLKQGAIMITVFYTLLMGITRTGWGASTPYGLWIGKILMFFGVSGESLGEFSKMGSAVFELPFFQHPISVQNFGIIVGAIIYLLTAGKLKDTFISEWEISVKDVFLFALGGITMGLGTRFANGCNVGALYTPIANFSLSGWVFLVFMTVGGVISNRIFFDRPLTRIEYHKNKISM